MSGVQITPAPTPEVAAAIVAAIKAACGGGPQTTVDTPGTLWRRRARWDAVHARGAVHDDFWVRQGGGR